MIERKHGEFPSLRDLADPTKVIPSNRLFRLRAKTTDSLRVTVDQLPFFCDSIPQPEMIAWDYQPRQVVFDSPRHPAYESGLTAVLSPTRELLIVGSEISYELNSFKISIKKLPNQFLILNIKANKSRAALERVMTACQDSISFLEARYLRIPGYEVVSRRTHSRIIQNEHIDSGHTVAIPLPHHPQIHKKLLEKAIPFFLTDKGSRFSRSLCLCWDAATSTAPVNSLVLSTSVERLVNLVDHGETPHKLTEVQKAKQQALLAQVRADRAAYGQGFFERLTNYVNDPPILSVPALLKKLSNSPNFQLRKSEIEAWKSVRNLVAHGKHDPLLDYPEIQMRREYSKLIMNIINKLTLAAMQYEGVVLDHAKPGDLGEPWSVIRFGASKSDIPTIGPAEV